MGLAPPPRCQSKHIILGGVAPGVALEVFSSGGIKVKPHPCCSHNDANRRHIILGGVALVLTGEVFSSGGIRA